MKTHTLILIALVLCTMCAQVAALSILKRPPIVKTTKAVTPGDVRTPGGPEIVRTIAGDVLNGRVIGISPDGTLRLAGPQFGGELTLASSALDRVTLQCTPSERGPDVVRTTNGDRIGGSVVAVSPESVDVQSGFAGLLKIPRSMVTGISFGGRRDLLVNGDFSTGYMEPWKPCNGSWKVESGQLMCLPVRCSNSTVYAKLHQTEAVTIVAHCKSTGPSLSYWLVVFADNTQGLGRNSVYAGVSGNTGYIAYQRNGIGSTLANRTLGRTVREGTIRLAYDPKTGKASLWFNSLLIGERTVPHKPQQGQYVILMSQYQYPSHTSYVRVLRGIVPPEAGLKGGAPETDTIQFGNKDKVSATDVVLADGQFVIKTAFGELTPDVKNVSQIVFRKKGREEPRRRKGDVRVETVAGRLTVQLKELTGEHLLGASSCGGQVKINRKAIRSIRFNIYRKLPAVAPKTGATRVPVPDLHERIELWVP